MDINATLLGRAVIFFVLIIGVISYLLGRTKTETPILTGIVGALLALVPPLGLIYIGVLIFKKDIIKN
ncbi:hypothetical protein [Aliidiomarina quisquiliarum]|uniref:hypothetical protein n=1 Tax=Aliidiomarina quisquiliarum TaxID=2938947 RepID=UPI00208E30C2|nr:hypothetical protein [Aliidiomarina quisquiliarum]MCO4321488.1 hypothetical protein [Aliidiomarina quisquiliarum]